MSDRDNYNILGLTPDADGTTVNRTYWHLARKYQALAPTDPRARLMLDELNGAYAVLGTPQLREEYDVSRRTGHAAAPAEINRASSSYSPARPNRMKASVSGDTAAGRTGPGELIRAWAPYGAVALLTAASLSIGAFAGNAVLVAAGACGVLSLAAVVARHKLTHLKSVGGAGAVRGGRAEDQPAEPRIRGAGSAQTPSTAFSRRRAAPAEDLHLSTASMVGRWRDSANANQTGNGGRKPDTTLVDIFQSERDVESPSEPLAAVLHILRGSHDPVEHR